MALQSLDIKRRSATAEITPPPGVRKPIEIAKLIDVTTCIGCKACQMKSASTTVCTTTRLI